MRKKNIILISLCILLSSCYTTKHIHKNDRLIHKNIINIENEKAIKNARFSQQEIKSIIQQKPNKKIFGLIPFHLWIYNLSNPKKTNWVNDYLRKIGEKPIVLDEKLITQSERQIKSYFENHGYFQTSITNKVKYKRKRAVITYTINPGKSYFVNKINYKGIENRHIYDLIKQKNNNSDLKTGDLFTYNLLNKERLNISNLLQNNGYYKFSKELIYIKADSNKNKEVNLSFAVKKENTDSTLYQTFLIDKIYIHLKNNTTKTDTVKYKNFYFVTSKSNKQDLKFDVIAPLIELDKNQLYSKEKVEKTYQNLSDLLFFKKIKIDFEILSKKNALDCNIFLEIPIKMYYSIEAEAKRSADEGNLGVSGYFQFGNNNLMQAAENINGKIRLSLENRQTSIKDNNQLFNTQEIFYELALRIPKLIIPKKLNEQLNNSYKKSTNLTFSISRRKRPDFSSQIISQKIGYSWANSKYKKHQFNLIEISFSDIGKLNSYIQEQVSQNPYLREQFEDKFIAASNYIFTFNNQKIYKIINYTYLKTKIESSGNMLSALSSIIELKTNDEGSHILFQNPFSQYIKLDVDCRRYIMLSKESTVIFRGFFGIAYAHTNSKELPIQKQFFSGGVNSIRAWEAFELGPGSIQNDDNYSTGDMKLEFNIEYRFQFLNEIKSALFIDGGNIWSVKNDPREGSVFKLNQFVNDIAIGVGYGIRYDFDFFVIRLDIATPIKDPALNKGETWIKKIKTENFRYNLAIGYPF